MITLPKINLNTFSRFRLSLPAILLAVVVLGSFIFQANFRNSHFQECDSSGVYNSLSGFPQTGLNFTAIAYQNSRGLISKDQAYKILSDPRLSQITAPVYKKYSKDFIADKLSQSSPLATIRYAEISIVGMLGLPYFLQSTLALPLSSTYSPAAGLFYGLITNKNTGYEIFMSRVLLLNLLIFHVCVLLLYATARKLKVAEWPSALVSLLMLFSISLYSTGFNAGSLIWIIFNSTLWLYLIATRISSAHILKYLSVVSGLLILFNYLIAFYWLGFLIGYWIVAIKPKTPTGAKNIIRSWLSLLASQKIALGLFFACGILFYPPGQGVRAISSFTSFGQDLYYVILNFFAFYVGGKPVEILQFLLGLSMVLWAFVYLFKNIKTNLFASVLLGIFAVYILTLLFNILGFGPTRHMLFLAPVLFLAIALAIKQFWEKTPTLPWAFTTINILLFISLVSVGFWSLQARHKVALDITAPVSIDSDVDFIGIHDCSFDLVSRAWPSPAGVDFINPKNFQAGKTYLFLSQTIPFSTAVKDWQKKFNIDYLTLKSSQQETNVFFTAYNPGFAQGLYTFTRPNNLYLEKFKINSIAPR